MKKIWTITGAAALSTALIAGGSIAASASPVPENADCQFGEHLVAAWLRLPADLRADLADLKALEPGTRGEAARDIRDGALAGEYGPGVQDRAERVQQRRIHVIASMPDELRADVVDLVQAEPDARRDLARDIAETALSGGYGPKTQAVAEAIQGSDAWQNCVAD